jgi:hypothetical protein
MNRIRTSFLYLICFGTFFSCQQKPPCDYKGTPYSDIIYHDGAQTIPGNVG